jgi:shikimate dehydrogenase
VISGSTALYGLLGHPVGHSLSPALHNAAFEALGLDAAYVAMDVPPERLAEAMRGAHALGFRGLNVTVPHKRDAALLCRTLDPLARLLGAVNTLRADGDGFAGSNTDAPAAFELLQAAGLRPGASALLGAGGAARAAGWALLRGGAGLRLAARRPEAAAELCAALATAFPGARIGPAAWEEIAPLAESSDVVVNATSIGLSGSADRSLPVALRRGQLALDFVYGETAFAREAVRAGARLVSGEQLLVRQGALAFTQWTGRPAPEPVMAAALSRAAAGAHR